MKPQETPIKSRVAVLESEFGVGSDESMSMPNRIERLYAAMRHAKFL